MKKSILEIYALAVCFVALVCFVIVLGIGVYDLIQITNPEFTINVYEYERHQSNEAFDTVRGSPGGALRGIAPGIPIEQPTERPEEEVTQQRQESYQAALRSERRRGMQSLIRIAIILMIDVLVFVPHWLLARRTRAASMVS